MQVRGKTVYLQYSTRQEIVNSKTQGDTPSNVLLVTLEALMVRLRCLDNDAFESLFADCNATHLSLNASHANIIPNLSKKRASHMHHL